MDPVSALGVASAACQFTQLAGHVADNLFQYTRKVKNAPKLSQELRTEALLVSDVLENLQSALPANMPSAESPSPNNDSGTLVTSTVKEFAKTIKEIAGRIEIKENELSWKRLKWPFTQKENESYLQKLERFKNTFQLILQTIQKKALGDIDHSVRRIAQDLHTLNLDVSQRQRDEKRLAILNWIFPDDSSVRHKAIAQPRVKNSGDWFLKTTAYLDWLNDTNPGVLFCHGMPGAGKSVIMSRVVDELMSMQSTDGLAVAYIYFDYNDPKSQLQQNVTRSLLKQLLFRLPLLPGEVENLYDECSKYGKSVDTMILQKHLSSLCSRFERVIILFDALDECTASNFKGITVIIGELKNVGAKVFCTSRIKTEAVCDKLGNPSIVEIRSDHGDVSNYVSTRLEDEWDYDEESRAKIKGSIEENAQGKFLLVRFQLDYVLGFAEPYEAIGSLSTLPMDMESAYRETLGRIEKAKQPTVIKVLSWLFHARRPLHKRELQEAIAVRPGMSDLPKPLLHSNTLVQYCQGLISCDEGSGIIRFTHFTVQEFLEKHYQENLLSTVDLAKVCLTYLIFNIFEKGQCPNKQAFEERRDAYRLTEYAAKFWGGYVKGKGEENEIVLRCLRKLLGSPQKRAALRQLQLHGQAPARSGLFELPKSAFMSWMPIHAIASEGLSILYRSVFPVDGDTPKPLEIGVVPVLKEFQNLELGTVWSHEAYSGTAPLLQAAKSGQMEMAIELMKRRADISSQDRNGWTALHYAAGNGHKDIVIMLLQHGADVGAQGKDGRTALHYAAGNRHKDIVIVLLQHGADVGAQGKNGRTALHYAAENGHKDIVIVLLQNGADVKAQNAYGETALHYAALNGHKDIMIVLLENGADAQNKFERTMLHTAVLNGHKDIVIVLLQNGADVEAQNYGKTALHYAAENGHEDIVIVLLQNGADVGAQNYGKTALHYAAGNGHKDIVIVLLQNGADVEAQNKHGETALHYAAGNGHKDIVIVLLQNGADVGAQNYGKTALHYAAENGHEDIVIVLLQNGADVGAQNYGKTALHYAAENGHEDIVIMLLQHGADVGAQGKDGRTALHYAAGNGHKDIVIVLLQNGADVEAQNKNGETALHYAAGNGHKDIVVVLLQNGADVGAQNKHGETALHYAAGNGHKDLVIVLLQNGADVGAQDKDGRTALQYAAGNGHKGIVITLLQHGADVRAHNYGWTALHSAVLKGYKDIVVVLLQNGADVGAQNKHGETALHYAAGNGHKDLVIVLLQNGADVGAQDKDGRTALHSAVLKGYKGIVVVLLQNGADFGAQDKDGETALQYAAGNGHKGIVITLLQHGADVRAHNYGWTALHSAVLKGYKDIVVVLLQNGADVGAQNYGWTTLHDAAGNGHKDIVILLLQNGADFGAQDKDGRTALHYAAWNGHKDIVIVLLQNGAHVGAQDRHGRTALHYAALKGYKDIVIVLLQNGADVGAQDRDERTAFHYAALKGYKDIVIVLLQNGADISATREWKNSIVLCD